MAKKCAGNGGARIFLTDHMKELWNIVGFVPVSFELDDEDKTTDDVQQAANDATVLNNTKLPPTVNRQKPSERDVENFDGITIRNFASNLEDKDILTFLVNHGMPIDHNQDSIKINRRGKSTWVLINDLSSNDVQTLFNSIHFHETNQKFSDMPLYCKSIRKMTPMKPGKVSAENELATADTTTNTDGFQKKMKKT